MSQTVSLQSLTQSASLPCQQRSALVRRQSNLPEVRLGLNSSASSSALLRDEQVQDRLFGVVVDAMTSLFNLGCLDQHAEDILRAYEELLEEHFLEPATSRLRSLIPELRRFFTPLPFAKAFVIYNKKFRITKRRYIPPTFHEVRHIMNVAQVMASAESVRLVTFDGDETLYPDGKNFADVDVAQSLTALLQQNIHVAVVTAAGYAYQTEKYEARLRGLLEYWREKCIPAEVIRKFFVFGGESNYLLRCNKHYRLQPVPEGAWRPHMSDSMKAIFDKAQDPPEPRADVKRLLGIAAEALEEACEDLNIRAIVTRKERAVGLVPGGAVGKMRCPTGSGMKRIRPEILDEVFFRVQRAIRTADPPLGIPFCAFNGGHDVWVDIGNKAEGLKTLQSFLSIKPEECLHVGDQFTFSGNDIAARDAAPTLWVCNPTETKAVLRSFLRFSRTAASSRVLEQTESDHSPDEAQRGLRLSREALVAAGIEAAVDPESDSATSPPPEKIFSGLKLID